MAKLFDVFIARLCGAEADRADFQGLPDAAFGAVPLSRAEQDAAYLAGIWPEPAEGQGEDAVRPARRFVRFILPSP